MNWKHEKWVRLYVREEGSFARLPLMARALGAELLKLCDEQGRIEVGDKPLADVVAFRLGATRGDRRMLAILLPDLFTDGYLVQVGGFVKVANYCAAQHRPACNEPATVEQRPCNDRATTVQRPCNDAATVAQQSSNENSPKSAESIETPPGSREKRREEKNRSEGKQTGTPPEGGPETGSLATREQLVAGLPSAMIAVLDRQWMGQYREARFGQKREDYRAAQDISDGLPMDVLRNRADFLVDLGRWHMAYLADVSDGDFQAGAVVLRHPHALFLKRLDKYRVAKPEAPRAMGDQQRRRPPGAPRLIAEVQADMKRRDEGMALL